MSTAAALLCSQNNIVSKLRITVVADEFSPNTTSDIAGGLWLPYKAGHPDLSKWCEETLDWLTDLRKTGKLPLHDSLKANVDSSPNPYRVALVDCISFESTPSVAEDRAGWVHTMKEPIKKIPIAELDFLPPHVSDCYALPAMPLVTTGQYLQRMRQELYSTGRVNFIQDKSIDCLKAAAKKYKADALINCTGLGSRRLLQDTDLHPVRGCLLTLELPPALKQKWSKTVFTYDDSPMGLTYILPREDYCYVGGTYLPNEWDPTVSELEQDAILSRAIKCVPELAQGKVLRRRAGLRPARSEIRLERDASLNNLPPMGKFAPSTLVFHNYGHGGSGWTVHWGCAKSIAKQVVDSLSKDTIPKAKL